MRRVVTDAASRLVGERREGTRRSEALPPPPLRQTPRVRRIGWLALLALLLLALARPAFAVEPRERLADPALEARARAISSELRCLVCQNESIDESGADLAHDIRMLVRERLTAGDTDAQAIQAVVNRYGAFVLLKPPVEPATYVLWYGPVRCC